MKQQFSKFKQAFVSKQEVPKQDRTEVLSGELQDAEKRIGLIKQASENTAKHVKNCLQCPSKDLTSLEKATDKRLKKVPEVLLGTNMIDTFKQIENSDSLKFESVLGQVLHEAGTIEQYLGSKLVSYEETVERTVLLPLQKLVDEDLPNIDKIKRTLTKLTGDMDSQQAKYNHANRHSLSSGTAKISDLKDDLDDIQQKLEQCRDTLATEMYQMIAREPEVSEHIVNFLRAQKEYHWAAYSYLEEHLPSVEAVLAKSNHKPVYGRSLEEHLQSSGRTIAYPIEVCVCGLIMIGLEEEGLFRVAGSASKMKKLKAAFDAGVVDLNRLLTEYSDPHVIANALKCYLREMPSPLLTYELHQEWIDAVQIPNPQNKLQSLWTVVDKLRCNYKPNFDNLCYLIKFLRELSKQQHVNKMTPANIAIVIAPNLLWAENIMDDATSDMPMGFSMTKMTPLYTAIVEQLVYHADYFFQEEINFFITYTRPTDSELLANGTSDEGGFEAMTSSKRSQSNSSLEDQNGSPPQGSPKPVLRRKNKPAPVPPAVKNTFVGKSSTETSDSSSKQQSSSSSESSQRDSIHKSVSLARRDGVLIPPPSPSQMNNRKSMNNVTGMSSSALAADAVPPPVTPSKVTPPKPPQPQFNQHHYQNQKDFDNSSKGDRAKPYSSNYASTLKHKSSFNSGSSSSNSESGSSGVGGTSSPSHKGGANHGGSSPYYSNSLPRHFHTDNSYKNQRAPRPPPIFATTPTVPVSTQPPVLPPPLSVPSEVTQSQPKQHRHSVSDTQQILEAVVKSAETPAEPVPEPLANASIPTTIPQAVVPTATVLPQPSIGFERLEAEIRTKPNDSLRENESPNVVSKEPTGSDGDDKGEEADPKTGTTSSPSSVSPGESSRPVPAPRSSLLHSVNASKDKPDNVPVMKERPTLMAKPRDLAKRTHHTPVISAASVASDTAGGDQHVGQTSATSVHFEADSQPVDGLLQKNGLLSDKTMPPHSPRAPNRPPRPQPPPPPKIKPESTDL